MLEDAWSKVRKYSNQRLRITSLHSASCLTGPDYASVQSFGGALAACWCTLECACLIFSGTLQVALISPFQQLVRKARKPAKAQFHAPNVMVLNRCAKNTKVGLTAQESSGIARGHGKALGYSFWVVAGRLTVAWATPRDSTKSACIPWKGDYNRTMD